jgi:hypothetical protein
MFSESPVTTRRQKSAGEATPIPVLPVSIRPSALHRLSSGTPDWIIGGSGHTSLSDDTDSTYVRIYEVTTVGPPDVTGRFNFDATSIPEGSVLSRIEVTIRMRRASDHTGPEPEAGVGFGLGIDKGVDLTDWLWAESGYELGWSDFIVPPAGADWGVATRTIYLSTSTQKSEALAGLNAGRFAMLMEAQGCWTVNRMYSTEVSEVTVTIYGTPP